MAQNFVNVSVFDRIDSAEIFRFPFGSDEMNFSELVRVSNNSELKGAPDIAKKCTNRCTIYYPPKSAIFLLQSAHFLIPYTIFIAFLCINFLEMSNFANSFFKFFSFSIISH